MSISSVFSRPRGNLVPTGLPINVDDEAERLALTPVEGMRVKQLDTGMTWAWTGFAWRPAPTLEYSTEPEHVLNGNQFQSRTHPTATAGEYTPLTVSDTRILPAQAWIDNIGYYVGLPINDTLASSGSPTYIDPTLVSGRLAQIVSAGYSPAYASLNSLALTNTKAILADVRAIVQSTPLTVNIDVSGGSNAKISPLNSDYITLNSFGNSATVNLQPCIATSYSSTSGWSATGGSGVFGISTDGVVNGMWHSEPDTVTSLTVDSMSESITPVNLNLESLSALSELHFVGVPGIASISNIPTDLTVFEFSGCSGFTPGGFNFSGFTDLSTLNVSGTLVNALDITGCVNLLTINISSCAFDDLTQDSFIGQVRTLAIGGLTGGTLNISNQAGSVTPTAQGFLWIADLETLYGWTVTT